MLELLLHVPLVHCSHPCWHPGGRWLWVGTSGRGAIVDIDRGDTEPRGGPGIWSPDGVLALERGPKGDRRVVEWPTQAPIAEVETGTQWGWMGSRRLLAVAKGEPVAMAPGGSFHRLAAGVARPGETWAAIHGLSDFAWAGLLQASHPERLSLAVQWDGVRPVERMRLPRLEGLGFGGWSWSDSEQGWLLIVAGRRRVLGWTFPHGLEWFQADAQGHIACACHMDDGAAWADDGGLHHWDAASHGQESWRGPIPTGLAWNPVRRVLAATFEDGIRLFQVGN